MAIFELPCFDLGFRNLQTLKHPFYRKLFDIFAIKVSVASRDSRTLGGFTKKYFRTLKIAKLIENVSSGPILIACLFYLNQ